MTEAAKKKATYEDLYSLPENMLGEIIAGELIATPRPSRRHASTTTLLTSRLVPPYYFGDSGGPGGWIILLEPELELGANILVPDLAGWREARFIWEEEQNPISVIPDWVCEVLSPQTARLDRVKKMPQYAEHGVRFLWLVDPNLLTLEAYRLENSRWTLLGSYAENDRVRAEPFQELEIHLSDLWPKTIQDGSSPPESV